MENFSDANISPDFATLSYDDTVAYDEQLPVLPTNDLPSSSLADRIGSAKVYLLSESSVGRLGKRKHASTEDGQDDDADMEEEDASYRSNALLFRGSPISHLPTTRLFAYATHFDAHPMGLEWVDDNTCVFVFESKAAARNAQRYLQKSAIEDMDDDGFVTAKPIPIALWPPEERINSSLGKGEGLKGAIRMRWAKMDDVKKRGAKKNSEFYKKHGLTAGKEVFSEGVDESRKRRRQMPAVEEAEQKAVLDDDIDTFLSRDSPSPPPSPPSKMRSDYIASDGKTLLERTSVIRAHPTTLESRITAPLPRRALGRLRSDDESLNTRLWRHNDLDAETDWGRGTHKIRGSEQRRTGDGVARNRRDPRPKKSQQELDDELESFLQEK